MGDTELNERELVRWIKEFFKPSDSRIRLGISDDAALLEMESGNPLALTADSIFEGRHFRRDQIDPELIGLKAAGVSLSDLAAMGSTPVCMLVSLGVGADARSEDTKAIFRGVKKHCQSFDCEVVGGDLNETDGDLVVTTTAIGECRWNPVTRSGASVGDLLYVTGEFGGSGVGRHLDFTPRVREGERLAESGLACSLIDVSDGLVIDLDRIREASGIPGAVLLEDQIPIHPEAAEFMKEDDLSPLHHALYDGEDFELLFSVKPEHEKDLEQLSLDVPVTQIGKMVDQEGLFMKTVDGNKKELEPGGYLHFS